MSRIGARIESHRIRLFGSQARSVTIRSSSANGCEMNQPKPRCRSSDFASSIDESPAPKIPSPAKYTCKMIAITYKG